MSNAAIYLHPNGFDTTGTALLGRHSAGESFLRGFLRHGDVDAFHLWNTAGEPQAKIEALLARIETPPKPVRWIGQADRHLLRTPGVLYMPGPSLDAEAFHRRPYGPRSYALCGVTHTTATATVMRIVPDLLVAPLESYDALICTSGAVRDAVEAQLSMMRDYLVEEFGPRKRAELMRATIPLGVNAADFAPTPENRAAWRTRLGIPDDAVVALYVGRHSVRVKMNPALMAMALERAAKRTDKPIYWLNSGWVEPASAEESFHTDVQALCPSVTYLKVDGRQPDVRFSIWAAADLFISFSDNIQETFGLTPIEAMAAGLPCVVSDWNGYKDTVRHEVDGFRIPTLSPRPGYGGDLAYWFANSWISYENYVGAAAQYTAVDLARGGGGAAGPDREPAAAPHDGRRRRAPRPRGVRLDRDHPAVPGPVERAGRAPPRGRARRDLARQPLPARPLHPVRRLSLAPPAARRRGDPAPGPRLAHGQGQAGRTAGRLQPLQPPERRRAGGGHRPPRHRPGAGLRAAGPRGEGPPQLP
jgi:glycosyltransferase involved in cell wall biosynthesis